MVSQCSNIPGTITYSGISAANSQRHPPAGQRTLPEILGVARERAWLYHDYSQNGGSGPRGQWGIEHDRWHLSLGLRVDLHTLLLPPVITRSSHES